MTLAEPAPDLPLVELGPLPSPAAGVLVSDVDSTFLTQEVIELVAEHAGTRSEVEDITARAMLGELDFAQSLRERVRTLAGLPADVLTQVRDALVPTPDALEMVRAARDAGWVVALVSGGFHEVIDELARLAGVHVVLANRFEIDDGRLTGRVSGMIVDSAAKRAALAALIGRAHVPAARSIAIGDGANDARMVEAAGVGVAFRAKPALREVADVIVEENSLLAAWEAAQRKLAQHA